MRRILIFLTAYLPLVGGAEIAVKEITNRIKDWEFDLITSRFSEKNPKKEKIGNITVYRVGLGTKFDKYLLPILGFLKARKLFRKNKYSLIWSISASYAGLAVLFFKLRNPNLPFLLTLQEGSSEQRIFRRTFIIRPLFKLIFKKADYIQAISRHLANFGKKMGARCPIEVVPNGVDIKKFSISNFPVLPTGRQFSINESKKKLGIKESEKVIITVSRLVPKNGVGDLIEAANLLKSQDINFKLLILGTGYLEKKLRLQVSSYRLQDRVLFLGLIPPAEVPKYLAISDVFVRPSISEGLGNVFLEAMAAGVPIIGTPVGGIPDFLRDRETGLSCQPNSPKSIAEAIRTILKDKDLYNQLTENGRKLVKEKYDWNIIAKQMNNIFNKLCAF